LTGTTRRKRKQPDFESAITELEAVVETMEKGELTLEQSLQSFERGVELTRICRETLTQAEQRIEILSGRDDEAEPEPFNHDA
jgi:exodeoxyribonuclease VII small subunit